MDDVWVRAIIGGIFCALMAGPLGCVLIWRRMAFFGEALAHGALFGVGLSLLFSIHIFVGVAVSSAILSVCLLLLQKGKHLSNDSVLGVLSHSFLAIGLIAVALVEVSHEEAEHVDGHGLLETYLFGDIMNISYTDIGLIAAVSVLSIGVLTVIWQRLMLVTFDGDLALAEGVNVIKIQIIFMMLVACAIAVIMQYVGILLTMSLLIIPAATASRFASSPEKMAVAASIIGMMSVVAGIVASMIWFVPVGAVIVVVATFIFVIVHIIPKGKYT